MKYLLDTHVLLWLAEGGGDIAPAALDALADPANDVVVSVASLWELAIKEALGKLKLPQPAESMCATLGLRVIDVRTVHVFTLRGLPPLHRDPFDRILVATAAAEGAVLVSRDAEVLRYPVASLAV